MAAHDPHVCAGPGPTLSRDAAANWRVFPVPDPVVAPGSAAAGVPPGQACKSGSSWRAGYLLALTWGFTLFSTARIVSYLPTLWAICSSGQSSQHSLWTWGIWFGSNVTMAAWLYEQAGQRWTRAAIINVVNAAMCAATFTVIVVFRG